MSEWDFRAVSDAESCDETAGEERVAENGERYFGNGGEEGQNADEKADANVTAEESR